MTLSEIAAWWGAGIGTSVFLWDIYKWRAAQANLRVSASPNMSFVSLNGVPQKEKLITVEVVNTGDKNTTLTHLVAMHYTNWFSRLRGKHSTAAVVLVPIGTQPLPHKLAPGERWLGAMNQEEVKKLDDSGQRLYCGVYHTTSPRPCLVRVQFKTSEEKVS